ncbi:FGGY-family carbohydrate kinase [Lacticaseibacillus suilingensis]|uniref:FGGY-family carbohydrate kinase n=1 Tax=Lacticaseibacillus suilingensis TaxID=2799577 RepID=UPI0022E36339|nr:FGGY family carbohydrate kinase [Lacticaseibacillus suilingensis]
MGRYLIGIDIGTYESRGMLLDSNYHVVSDCSVKHSMSNPKPGFFEHDAEDIWGGDFCKIAKSLLSESHVAPEDVECVGASALGTDCVPVDHSCTPLRPAILYGIDARATEEARWLTEYYGESEVNRLFGHKINSGDTATKILWIKNNEPEVYDRTYKFLTGSSFITAKLTGQYVIDQALAKGSFRPLYNADGTVNEAQCEVFCRPNQLAESRVSTDIVGTVTKAASIATGLAQGTPVVTGTGDSTSEAISAGLVEAGTVFFQYGSSMFYYYCTDKFIDAYTSPSGNGSLKGGKDFTIPGTFCLGDGTNAAGTLTRWVRDTFYKSELLTEATTGENAYTVMSEEASEVPVGADGLIMLPYIYGERSPLQDSEALGMIFGLTGGHDRRHINRAALESVAYSTYQHMRLFSEIGLEPERVITAGGGTKNITWMQIVCDMLGKPLQIPEDFQCSAYGDAMIAAIGSGQLAGFSALRRVLPTGRVLVPNSENHQYYAQHYPIFRDLYLNNRSAMYTLSRENHK